MEGFIGDLRRIWRLFQSDDRSETVMAVFTLMAVVLPFVLKYRQLRKEMNL